MREASLRLDALAGGAVLCFFGGIAFVHKLLDEPAVRECRHIKVVFADFSACTIQSAPQLSAP